MVTATPRPNLYFGERFKVRSHRGKLYVLTFLHWVEGEAGVYVRLGNRDIARLNHSRVEWSSWAAATNMGDPPVGDGDEVLVSVNGHETMGRLLELNRSLILRVPGGGVAEFPLEAIEELNLLYRAPKIRAGDRFLGKTKMGTDLRGLCTEQEGGLLTVHLQGSGRIQLAHDSIDLNTVYVLVPVPTEELLGNGERPTEHGFYGDDDGTGGPPRPERDVEICCNPLAPTPLVPGHVLTVGRSNNHADLVLPSKTVSRRHAEFCLRDGGIYVRDLGSLNGTWVGPERVGARWVRVPVGARIQIEAFQLSINER
jgi:hypothetical protein